MKPELKHHETHFPYLKNRGSEQDNHFVFVTDDSGISSAFNQIKSHLRNEEFSFLTLIYFVLDAATQPLFKSEIENLEKRYPSKLITHFVFSESRISPDNFEKYQQILEIVINSNTCDEIQYLIIGELNLFGMISDRLHFLGINSNQIKSQIF